MKFFFEIKHFNELTALEFHDLLKLRVEVFVIEQNCPYPEVDGIDTDCFHVIVKDNNKKIIGTSRIIPKGIVHNEWSIGRLVVNKKNRRKKIASNILNKSIQFIYNQNNNNKEKIKIDALKYLKTFYQSYNFTPIREYIEYDWEYIEMTLN